MDYPSKKLPLLDRKDDGKQEQTLMRLIQCSRQRDSESSPSTAKAIVMLLEQLNCLGNHD
ncbi:hypothetical protein O9993_17300 [Vibrio lentus]|nr:hypothetical protein [Vibrio lentus]